MPNNLTTAKSYEAALFSGDMAKVASYFTDDITYWVAGPPRIGGEWHGRQAVIDAMANRAMGLGAADWGYEDVWRQWHETDEGVMVEIREHSWLKSHPEDVMDQRTCVVLKFRDDKICEMRDYTDAQIYQEFLERHRAELPKFAK